MRLILCIGHREMRKDAFHFKAWQYQYFMYKSHDLLDLFCSYT